MAAVVTDISQVHRISLDRYHEWIALGAFGDDERIELLEGVLVEMSPRGEGHDDAIVWLNQRFVLALAGRLQVRPQTALTFPDLASEPEPDLAVVSPDAPKPYHFSEALLVIEVSVTSLRHDRGPKALLYARAGVPEYWVVDLVNDAIEVRTVPSPDGYAELHTAHAGETLVPQATGAPEVPVGELLAAAARRRS